jgi:hypothetical protein
LRLSTFGVPALVGPDPGDLVPATDLPDPDTIQGWYSKLASAILLTPGGSLKELAIHCGQSQRWVATIKNSDSFKAYLRKREVNLENSIKEKSAVVAELALDELIHRIEDQGLVMPVTELSDIADKAAKRLGFGASAPMGLAVSVGVSVERGDLEAARQKMQETFGVQVESSMVKAPLIGSTSLPRASESEVDGSISSLAFSPPAGADRREGSKIEEAVLVE